MKKAKFAELNLEDIAEISGVSRSTVSRVVNGHPNVSEQTRVKVMDVIRQYNFKPNPAARALASQHLHVIGILIPHLVSEIFTDPFFPLLIQSITTTANQLDYSVTLWLASAEVERQTFYNQVFNHRLTDGLIIASAVVDHPLLHKLDNLGKPYIIVGRPSVPSPSSSFVDVESQQGAYLMTRHLAEQGRRHIAMIPGLRELASSQDRELGYRIALQECNLPYDPNLMAPTGNYQERGGYESMKLLMQTTQVDAVFAASDVMAVGAMRAITEAGLRVPEDIAVGGFDDMPFAEVSNPPLTTIRQPINLLGSSAAEGLITLLQSEQPTVYQRLFPVELVVRKST